MYSYFNTGLNLPGIFLTVLVLVLEYVYLENHEVQYVSDPIDSVSQCLKVARAPVIYTAAGTYILKQYGTGIMRLNNSLKRTITLANKNNIAEVHNE